MRHLFEGVNNATWDATYDIYMKTDTKEKQVTFIYKAAIQQSTGEVHMIYTSSIHPHINLNFSDIPLTLETVIPSSESAFQNSIPGHYQSTDTRFSTSGSNGVWKEVAASRKSRRGKC
jgi:hypothetical protein